MPKPTKNESKDDFLQRCMGDSETQKYPQDQRYAICNSLWEKERMSELKERIKKIKKK